MWRVIRFVAGAFVLLLAASQSSAQGYTTNCQHCDFGTGEFSLRVPICLGSDVGDIGNSHCQTHAEWDFMHMPKLSCLLLGNACFPTQAIPTYLSYWIMQNIFGLTAMASGGGIGCCEPDGTDWCAVWGMPSGCT